MVACTGGGCGSSSEGAVGGGASKGCCWSAESIAQLSSGTCTHCQLRVAGQDIQPGLLVTGRGETSTRTWVESCGSWQGIDPHLCIERCPSHAAAQYQLWYNAPNDLRYGKDSQAAWVRGDYSVPDAAQRAR